MKKIVLIICFFAFCQSMLCQISSESKFVEQDSTIEIFKENNISLKYYNNINSDELWYINLRKNDYSAEFVFFINCDYQDLFVANLNKFSENHFRDREIIQVPYNYYLFRDNFPIAIDLNIKREFRCLRGEDYFQIQENNENQKYSYLIKEYSHVNKQLLRTGNAFSYFFDDFIFENCDVFPYGEWLEIEKPIIKNSERLTDYFDFKFEDLFSDLVHENKLNNGKIKWTLTDSALFFQISFSLNENKSFYFNVNIESKPYIEEIIIQDYDAGNIVSHYFSANGDISKSISSNNFEIASFLYDGQGFLSSKTTIKKENPNEAIKETFDIDKEYKTIVTDEDSIN